MKNLIAFIILSLFMHTTTEAELVLDSDGDPLSAGNRYYILPFIIGQSGGVTTLPVGPNRICPLYVGQAPFEVDNGLPLTFTPVESAGGVILESTDLNIEFGAPTVCDSNVWRLVLENILTGQYFIGTGGVLGLPGPATIFNWFKIERSGPSDYKLVYCPTICSSCELICRDIGIFLEGEKRLLALSDVPLRVVFLKDSLN